MPMNRATARVIDPVLSKTAQGYKNQEFAAQALFPFVDCPKSGIRLMKFGKEAFVLYAARRAPGAKTERVQYGYADEPVALVQDALEGVVPREWIRDTQDVPGVDQEVTAVNNVMRSIMLALEVEAAGIAEDANNYDANHKVALTPGTDQWSVAGVNIAAQVRDYKEAVRASIGVYPNTMQICPRDWNAMAENDLVRDRFKYTSADSLTIEMAKRYLELENLVIGKSVSAADETADFTDIWNSTELAYVPPESERNMAVPSFGYTYRLVGHPLVEEGYYEKNIKSWVYPVEYERRPYQTGMSAGFLIQNAS